MTVNLNTTQVFFPPSSASLCFQLQPEGTKAVPDWTSLFSCPFQKFLEKLKSSQASARTRLAELPPWGNAFAENKDGQCCTYCCGCCISYSRQLLLLLQWLVSLRKGCTLTAEPLNQLLQQNTSLQPDDYFPAVGGFLHLQGVLSKLPALLATLTVWQEHSKAFHLHQPWLQGWATSLTGLHKHHCSRMEL